MKALSYDVSGEWYTVHAPMVFFICMILITRSALVQHFPLLESLDLSNAYRCFSPFSLALTRFVSLHSLLVSLDLDTSGYKWNCLSSSSSMILNIFHTRIRRKKSAWPLVQTPDQFNNCESFDKDKICLFSQLK